MLVWLGLLSVAMFVGSLLAIPWILARLPADYFDVRVPRRHFAALDGWPALRTAALVLKNIVGFVLALAGVAMLVLPGQGILTILIGISLMDFPGKRRLEAAIVGRPLVLKGINALRARLGKEPLRLAPLG